MGRSAEGRSGRVPDGVAAGAGPHRGGAAGRVAHRSGAGGGSGHCRRLRPRGAGHRRELQPSPRPGRRGAHQGPLGRTVLAVARSLEAPATRHLDQPRSRAGQPVRGRGRAHPDRARRRPAAAGGVPAAARRSPRRAGLVRPPGDERPAAALRRGAGLPHAPVPRRHRVAAAARPVGGPVARQASRPAHRGRDHAGGPRPARPSRRAAGPPAPQRDRPRHRDAGRAPGRGQAGRGHAVPRGAPQRGPPAHHAQRRRPRRRSRAAARPHRGAEPAQRRGGAGAQRGRAARVPLPAGVHPQGHRVRHLRPRRRARRRPRHGGAGARHRARDHGGGPRHAVPPAAPGDAVGVAGAPGRDRRRAVRVPVVVGDASAAAGARPRRAAGGP